MGLAKSRFIEEQEQGWTFFRNKFACPVCFQDEDIRVFIQEIATEKECSYCDSLATDEPIAADMNEIMELIMDGFRLEWGDPNDEGMPWDSGEGGWLGSVFDTDERGGSISLNSLQAVDKWLSALVMPPPSLALAG